MSLNKLSLIKMKKKCQNTLYNSIEKELKIFNSQSYMPVFSTSVEIKNNDFSKRLFVFNSKNIILNINELEDNIQDNIQENIQENIQDNIQENNIQNKMKIYDSLQGKINVNIINKDIYTQANHYDSYKNYIITKDIFIKSNPILDVLKHMEGNYKTNIETPSLFSYRTYNKINNINNNAYIEIIACYYLNLLTEKNLTSLFPIYYGSFNGISKSYCHDISEDYQYIKDTDWFLKNHNKLFEIIKEDNLSDFDDITFENMNILDYENEKNLQSDNDIDNISLEDINFDSINLGDDLFGGKKINCEIKNNSDIESDIESDINSDIESDNESISLSISTMSNQSCIVNEIYSKLNSIPVQILAMELMEYTLTNLIKNGLEKEEWKSILFQICFGLAIAQKHLNFIHNDLHTDNIMFVTIKEEYKYFMYQNKYYKVPTFGKETKVIDFARGILKVNNKTYFSDVFKKNGDAGGQYGYMNSCLKKKKNYNLNFDLARLGTTIINYLDDEELSLFVNSWTKGYNGCDFTRMDDDFSLYVEISKYSTNALPKNQITRDFFKEYIIDKKDIPENSHVYIFN